LPSRRIEAQDTLVDIVATRTVKDLGACTGLAFNAVGEHELKGVPDRWRLYRVMS
jgi:hypothetical protein